MPKFPVISWSYLMKFLEFSWFSFMRVVGSHYVFSKIWNEKKITTVVPKHKELDIGTLKGILKQAEIETIVFLEYHEKK